MRVPRFPQAGDGGTQGGRLPPGAGQKRPDLRKEGDNTLILGDARTHISLSSEACTGAGRGEKDTVDLTAGAIGTLSSGGGQALCRL